MVKLLNGFQFLGIPPKGEHRVSIHLGKPFGLFPISRDPPEGGTPFKIGRDGTREEVSFQFLGIPPKGERNDHSMTGVEIPEVSNF